MPIITIFTNFIEVLLALLTICSMFVIFRLEWLRREIDDYRGRIMQFDQNNEEKYLNWSDKEFNERIKNCTAKLHPEEKIEKEKMLKYTLKGSILLFEKRYRMKHKVIQFFKISSISIGLILIIALNMYTCLISIILVLICIELYNLLKNDY